jgi:hypothetical protein
VPGTYDYNTARNTIANAYQSSLGRAGSDEEIQSHLRNVGYRFDNKPISGVEQIISAIYNSEEGQNYRAQNAPPAAAPAPAPASGGGGAVTPSGSARYTGYDFNQPAANRDSSKSAKYALAEIVEAALRNGGRMPTTHDEAQAFAQQYLVPGFQGMGYNIRDVNRDTFRIDTRENDNELIDWLVNAGGENPEIGWQSDAVGGNANADLVSPVSQLRGLGGQDFLMQLLSGNGGLGNADLLARINAEIQRLMAGSGGGGAGGGAVPTSDDETEFF